MSILSRAIPELKDECIGSPTLLFNRGKASLHVTVPRHRLHLRVNHLPGSYAAYEIVLSINESTDMVYDYTKKARGRFMSHLFVEYPLIEDL